MKLIYPPQPDPSALAMATAESEAAKKAVTDAEQALEAANTRAAVANRALSVAQAPANYAANFAELVTESKRIGNTLIAKPILHWDGKTMAPVGHEIACVMPGNIQCKAKRLSESGRIYAETFYRRPGGRWATSRSSWDAGEWHEATE